jgi:hypothetical protein
MRTWQATIGGLGMAAVLAACGGGFAEESPETILEETEKDMKALSSLRMEGEITSGEEELTFDMALDTNGDCTGTMGVAGGQAEIISVDDRSYMKPDAAFWESFAGGVADQIQSVVGDKWVVMPGEQGDLSDMCDLDELLSDLGGEDAGKAEVEGTEEVEGQETVKVSTETDEGDPLTVWISTDDPHHILKMEVTEGEEPGTITLSEFDEDIDVEAPSEDEVIDLEQLSQLG